MIDSITGFFAKGGPFMIPLGICSITSVTFMLERGFALRRSEVIPETLYNTVFNFKIGQPTSDLERMASPGRSTLARLVRVCLEHLPWSKAENVEAVQTRARREISHLERGLVILEIIVGISPLLGLLGTISGLITIFGNVGGTSIAEQGMILAKGISEALNTTVVGLVVAIPSLIAYSYYSKKVETLAVEMESICMDLLTKLYLQPPE
ncbi:MAG: MotA/TolQ/ExbB proton channel family protein [Methylacidiphilales bacterium]|nr:MotA/TolQ/ExbB proton channel family protein [Candidatus Methylacidiphilales bacterium]